MLHATSQFSLNLQFPATSLGIVFRDISLSAFWCDVVSVRNRKVVLDRFKNGETGIQSAIEPITFQPKFVVDAFFGIQQIARYIPCRLRIEYFCITSINREVVG